MSLQSEGNEIIDFLAGKPASSLLPAAELAFATQTVFSNPAISTAGLQRGNGQGYEPLRHQISSWIGNFYGFPSNPEQICITGGSSQGLSVILQVLTDPLATKAVWIAAPCFPQICRIFEEAGFTDALRAVRENDEGIDIEYLERGMAEVNYHETTKLPVKPDDPNRKIYSHVIYVVPTFSNPSGKTMSLSCRQKLVALAQKFDALIIADDVYDPLQWSCGSPNTFPQDTASLPRLIDVDRSLPPLESDPHQFGHALSNATFSTIIAPGMRTGWVDASPALTHALSECGSAHKGGCPSQFASTIISQFLGNGDIQKHLNGRLIPAYQNRHRIMVEAIETHLGPLGVDLPRVSLPKDDIVGGLFLWLRLPEGVMSSIVENMAKEFENLIIGPGSAFGVTGDGQRDFEQYLRLSFSWEDERNLVEGIVRLGRVIRRILEGRKIMVQR